MLQSQHEALHAAVADGQVGAQVADQPAQREQQRHVALDLVAELDACIEVIRRRVVRQRIVGLAVQPVQVVEHRQAEAAAHAVAWQAAQRAQVADAHAVQAFAGVVRQAGAPHRHAVQHLHHRCRLHHRQAIAQAGEHMRRARRGRQRETMLETQQTEFLA